VTEWQGGLVASCFWKNLAIGGTKTPTVAETRKATCLAAAGRWGHMHFVI